MKTTNWFRLYGESWKGAIVDESFAHPAKFSRGLIRAIYDHAIAEGWLKAGDRVADPFGGVALGGLDAMRHGLHWVGVELEDKFVALGNQNIDFWNGQFAGVLPGWGSAVLLQGDSRQLRQVVGESVSGSVSSPPFCGSELTKDAKFAATVAKDRRGGSHLDTSIGAYDGEGNLATMSEGDFAASIASPPFGAGETRDRSPVQSGEVASAITRAYTQDRQGDTPGNLAHMDACVSSPPYATGRIAKNSKGVDRRKQWETYRSQGGGMGYEAFCEQQNRHSFEYGDALGQLQTLEEGNFEASISSPPFEDAVGSDDPEKRGGLYRDPKRAADVNLTGTYGESEGQLGAMKGGFAGAVSSPPYEGTDVNPGNVGNRVKKEVWETGRGLAPADSGYGDTEGQLGAMRGEHSELDLETYRRYDMEPPETFWSAARQIVEEVYALLVPGAVSIWVVKAFVRDKKIVDFPGQWQQLCEVCGFETIHYHRAWMVEEYGTQQGFFEDKDIRKARKSFFRRLYEKKYPENRIDYEVVLCMRKPL